MQISPRNISGISIGGFDNCLRIAKINLTLDLGKSVSFLKPQQNIFISHRDKDHIEGLPFVIKQSINKKIPFRIYTHLFNKQYIYNIIKNMNVENPNIILNFVKNGDILNVNKMSYEFFSTLHTKDSLGLSIISGGERILTYTGDIGLFLMRKKYKINIPQLLNTENLIIETSAILKKTDLLRVDRNLHCNILEVKRLADQSQIKNIILYHYLSIPHLLINQCSKIEKDIKKQFKDRKRDYRVYYLSYCRLKLKEKKYFKNPIRVI